jgi:hypothetical protein
VSSPPDFPIPKTNMHVKGNDETFLIHLQSVEIPCCTPIHLSGGSGVVAAGGLQTGGGQLIAGRRRVRWQGRSSPTPTSRPPSSGKKCLRPPSSRHPPSAVLLATVLDSVPPYTPATWASSAGLPPAPSRGSGTQRP